MHLLIFLELPSYGTVRTALPLSYTLFNKTATVQEIEAKIEQSEHFMFTGSKEVRYFNNDLRILIQGPCHWGVCLLPLQPALYFEQDSK